MQPFRSKCWNSGRLAAKACRDLDKSVIAVKQPQNVVKSVGDAPEGDRGSGMPGLLLCPHTPPQWQ